MNKKLLMIFSFMLISLLQSCSGNKQWVSNRWKLGGEVSFEGQFDRGKAASIIPCLNYRLKNHTKTQNYTPHNSIPIYASMIKQDKKLNSHVTYIRHNNENFFLKNTQSGKVEYECYSPRYINRQEDYYNAYNERYKKIKYLKAELTEDDL